MTDQEWTEVVAMLRHWWPGEFAPAAAEGYRLLLGRAEAKAVGGALGAMVEAGQKFRPSAVDIHRVLTGGGRVAFADPEHAWSLVERAVGKVRFSHNDPRFSESHQAAVDWLREQDEAVAAWAASRGLCGPGSLGAEPVLDPAHGGAVKFRLRGDYEAVVEHANDRVSRGLAAFEERQFRLPTGRSGGGMDELLEHLRPAAALPSGETS